MTAKVGVYSGISGASGTRLPASNIQGAPARNDVGSASFQVPLGGVFDHTFGRRDICFTVEPDTGSNADLFNGIVTGIQESDVIQGEDFVRTYDVTVSGVLEEWRTARIDPPNGYGNQPFSTDRILNFAKRDFPDGSWTPAVSPNPSAYELTVDPWSDKNALPLGWGDPLSSWMSSRHVDGNGSMPLGSFFNRRALTTSSSSKILLIYGAADDGIDIWVDESLMLRGAEDPDNSFGNAMVRAKRVSGTSHMLAWEVKNYYRNAPNVLNPSSASISVYQLDTLDEDFNTSNFLFHTGLMPSGGGPIPDGVVCADFPSVRPGFSVGAVIRILLAECQARGVLSGWSLDFDDSQDSHGSAWAYPKSEFLFRVGDNMLTMLNFLLESYIDYRVIPGTRRLQTFNKGTVPNASTVVLDGWLTNPTAANLSSLTYATVF